MKLSILITHLLTVFSFTITITFAQHAEDPDPLRLESQIQTFQDWDRKNSFVENYSQKQERLYYVDLASPLLDENHKPDPSFFLDDLLHLNEDGYKVWTETIEPKLLNILNE